GVSVREAIEFAKSYVKQRLPNIPKLVLYQRQVEVKNFVAGDDFPLTRMDFLGGAVSRAHASSQKHFSAENSKRSLIEFRSTQGLQRSTTGIAGRTDTLLSKTPRPRTGKDYALLIASNE